jgi:hypothetical protein
MMGVAKALGSWRSLLKPGGKLALSEAVWLRSDPPEEVRRIWSGDYPDMGTVGTCRALACDCGYRLLGDFVLPEAAWWEYYEPMQQRLDLLPVMLWRSPCCEKAPRKSPAIESTRATTVMYFW